MNADVKREISKIVAAITKEIDERVNGDQARYFFMAIRDGVATLDYDYEKMAGKVARWFAGNDCEIDKDTHRELVEEILTKASAVTEYENGMRINGCGYIERAYE